MAKKSQPQTLNVTLRDGQLSSTGGTLSNFFLKQVPVLGVINSQNINADAWRRFVAKQEVAVLCRDAITNHLVSLDWKIVARDANQLDELKTDIEYYTKLFERGNAFYYDLDLTSQLEWFVKDLFDLPFGTASEFGREYDSPDGKVVWIRPLDGGTLIPTLNADWPIMQVYPSKMPVYLPRDSVSRAFLSPRTEIKREGWGLAPPEKIYLAMEMLNLGDAYYAQLLSNTPDAGIIDLIDVDKTTAEEWVKSTRDLLYGVNPQKISVLYEHTQKAEWIPFGKLPSEILYDSVTNKYITLVTSGYGLSPSDIGFASSSNGGETLSGTIRAERRANRNGKAIAEKKWEGYANAILPETLKWKWISQDSEEAVAMSRARMADANAATQWVTNKIFTPGEIRRQSMADGLFTVSMSEEPPAPTDKVWGTPPAPTGAFGKALPNQIGAPKAPSAGGQGDAIPQQVISKNAVAIQTTLSKAAYAGNQIMGALFSKVRDSDKLEKWEQKFDDAITGKSDATGVDKPFIDETLSIIQNVLNNSDWIGQITDETFKSVVDNEETSLKQNIRGELLQKAEEEFIQGSRDEITLTTDEELKISNINISKDFPQISERIRRSLLSSIASIIILVSKAAVLDYKYGIDCTDHSDNNTLKLARDVSSKVFGMLPKIVNGVYDETMKSLTTEEI